MVRGGIAAIGEARSRGVGTPTALPAGRGAAPPVGSIAASARASAIAISLVAFACGIDKAPPEPAPGEPIFSAIHNGILERSCALGSCHGGAAPAAKLDFHLVSIDDVVKICHSLVRRPSCLFPNRLLVVPGKPEASFLLDKLHGEPLDGEPEPSCGTSNVRMPLGLPPLAPSLVAQIEEWIRLGADCAGPPPIDAAIDAPIDADLKIPADILSITAVATTIVAGQRTQVTVTLTGPAPTDGQNVILTVADPTVLAAPAAVHVDRGVSSVTFDVVGKRPAGPTLLTAEAGTNSMSLSITVTGLGLSEILYRPATDEANSEWIQIFNSSSVEIDLKDYSFGSGRADYTATRTQLSGILPAGGCFVIGGPASNAGNGNPSYGQVANFSPDLLDGSGASGQATGYALFNARLSDVTATSIPIDAVLCGQNNGAGLFGPDGLPAVPICPDVSAAGHSVERTNVTTWVDQATPTPGNCTPSTLQAKNG
jgi:hypothetical protein